MGIGNWIKNKWENITGESNLKTTQQYLGAAVGRIENLEKGYDFLRQNAVAREDFANLRCQFRLVAGAGFLSLVLAVLSSAGVIYLLIHHTAR